MILSAPGSSTPDWRSASSARTFSTSIAAPKRSAAPAPFSSPCSTSMPWSRAVRITSSNESPSIAASGGACCMRARIGRSESITSLMESSLSFSSWSEALMSVPCPKPAVSLMRSGSVVMMRLTR